AYVKMSLKAEEPLQEQNLMVALQQKLSVYMLPASIIQLSEFPRTPNGKIDVSALPLPNHQSSKQELAGDYITKLVAKIWANVLEIECPIYDVDFFQLGGHSLLAARVIAHLQSELQVTISLKEFFRATQISELSQLIRIKQNEQKVSCPIVPVDRSEIIPLSLQQNRLWVLNELNFNKNLYNISGAYRLHGDLNSKALETAFKQLLEHHEVLRTSFRMQNRQSQNGQLQNGQPFQHIENDVSFTITEQSISDQDISTLVKQEAQKDFDIEKAPLVRVKLLKLASDERILLITFHHLVFDGGSWGVLINEITRNYNAALNKTVPVFTPLPVQFADYAHWQRKMVNSEHLSKQLDFWLQQLKGLPPLLHLPIKQSRPAKQRFQGDLVPVAIDSERLQKLLQFSQTHGVTLHMTLLTIFQVLLAKLSGQHDIAVGTPVANRSHLELENLIGFFVNTLVIRNSVEPSKNFLLALQNSKQTTLGAYENQDISFEQIVEAVQPERSLSNSPLFQVLFSLQNAPASSAKLKDITLESEPYQSHSSRFDLVLNLQQSDDGLHGYLEYDIDLFEKATISRWHNHYIMLIDSILAEANRPIHAIPMLSSQDKALLHQFSSGPIKTIETNTGIHGLIKAQFLKHPDAIAIRQGKNSITYAELESKAEQIARWLQDGGLKAGNRVGVNLVRKIDFFIVMLAILKAGGNYVPIDPTYPLNRQKLIAEDADLFLLISESVQSFENIDCLTLNDVINQPTTTSVLPELKQYDDYSDFPAYMIYTSGSTGRPKGVSIQHGGLCNMIIDQIDSFRISHNDRVLQFASLSFDVSILEIFLALASGARLVLPEEQNGNSILESLQSELCHHKVTIAILLPTVLPHLNPDELPDLRLVYTGAEVVSVQLVKLWSKGRRFVNAYGPTECTVMATAYECSTDLVFDPPIGRPIANSHVVVLSENDEWCGIGVAGEICIMGPGVAGSYWRQNEVNNLRFTKFSFNGDIQVMYRTGDIGRWKEDGNLEFIGRKDKQIKIRGFRIEIDEIVTTLQQCKYVSEVVVVVDKETEHTRLLAYFVGETSVDTIREHVKSILPAHMIPSAIIRLEAIPHTANRKVDYSRLPAIEQSEPENDLIGPRNG
ncbi:MAG: amino acid adenylation domain-containing protein, partial [Alcanivoracaceae bacterium]|nr:amino acid adenylation domain-containing protein [Alcanivoracaceae bacterium]